MKNFPSLRSQRVPALRFSSPPPRTSPANQKAEGSCVGHIPDMLAHLLEGSGKQRSCSGCLSCGLKVTLYLGGSLASGARSAPLKEGVFFSRSWESVSDYPFGYSGGEKISVRQDPGRAVCPLRAERPSLKGPPCIFHFCVHERSRHSRGVRNPRFFHTAVHRNTTSPLPLWRPHRASTGTWGGRHTRGFGSSRARARCSGGWDVEGEARRNPAKLSGEEFPCRELSSPVPGGGWQSPHVADVGPEGAPSHRPPLATSCGSLCGRCPLSRALWETIEGICPSWQWPCRQPHVGTTHLCVSLKP